MPASRIVTFAALVRTGSALLAVEGNRLAMQCGLLGGFREIKDAHLGPKQEKCARPGVCGSTRVFAACQESRHAHSASNSWGSPGVAGRKTSRTPRWWCGSRKRAARSLDISQSKKDGEFSCLSGTDFTEEQTQVVPSSWRLRPGPDSEFSARASHWLWAADNLVPATSALLPLEPGSVTFVFQSHPASFHFRR
ncbi:hypothetical protein QBC34DRAFT_101285 [Podospora aff. communis PSN243]|uniref:Uncharacterized protein n=1 Tax=Podospora aff. communis PSN243 TaxID=3040156 RepID=A0AAV9GL75_9PEZI|nr:hypothetical protein QBC34DRAFT_101285 [Podospora aff. communis PSN243]